MISDEFFKVKKDLLESEIVSICSIYLDWYNQVPAGQDEYMYEEYIDAYAAFESYLMSKSVSFEPVKFSTDKKENIIKIADFFGVIQKEYDEKLTVESILHAREKYKQKFGVGFLYEFTDGDLKRIQKLINELRDLVVESEDFDANHKDRVLKRLEKMQRELYKKMSSLDSFWGMIGEAGVVLGKFGKDAKPFVDRIREITQIVWNTQIRAEELPSGFKMPILENKTPEDE